MPAIVTLAAIQTKRRTFKSMNEKDISNPVVTRQNDGRIILLPPTKGSEDRVPALTEPIKSGSTSELIPSVSGEGERHNLEIPDFSEEDYDLGVVHQWIYDQSEEGRDCYVEHQLVTKIAKMAAKKFNTPAPRSGRIHANVLLM